MITVYIVTKTCTINYRKVDSVQLIDKSLSIYIDGRSTIYNIDDILIYEIRKEN